MIILKKICTFIIALFLVSCNKNNEVKISEKNQYDYKDITQLIINKEEIFSFANDSYYVYFYKENCSHCNSIKQTIIKEAVKRNDIYFFDDTGDILKVKDLKNPIIGISKSEDIFIYGTPMLINVEYGAISSFYLGTEQIINFLDQ